MLKALGTARQLVNHTTLVRSYSDV